MHPAHPIYSNMHTSLLDQQLGITRFYPIYIAVALEQESHIIYIMTFVIELQIHTSVSEIDPYPYHSIIEIYPYIVIKMLTFVVS